MHREDGSPTAIEMNRRGLRERLVRVSPAPGQPFDHGLFDIVVEPADEPSGRWRPWKRRGGARACP
jgi:hypothetical protein